MTYIRADFVKETTSTTGTGNIATAGPPLGSRPFSAVCSLGDTFPYSLRGFDAQGNPNGDFEAGVGTYVAVNLIARTNVLVSSNGNNLVPLAGPTAQIAIAMTAEDFSNAMAGKVSTSDLAGSGGAALVGFGNRTLADKLGEFVNVFDYMSAAQIADVKAGTALVDVTTPIQSAINALNGKGGTIGFPAGAYKVTASLNWICTVNADQPGIMFKGAGRDATFIRSYIASGPLFQVQGTKTQASGGTGSHFFNGGGFADMWLDGTHATGTSQAIRVNGWQYAKVSNLRIDGFPGDGITQYTDAGYSNGDYSSSSINFVDTWFWNNAGVAINQTGYIGAWSWKFDKCLFGYNGTAAVITSSGCGFFDCSFTGSGFNIGGSAIAGSSGYHVKVGTAAGSTTRITVDGCEFDFARLGHVSLDYCQTIDFKRSRMIFNDRLATGSMTPPVGINIAPAGADSNVSLLRFEQVNVRVDTTGTLTAFNLANFANASAIDINGVLVSDNTSGAATITKYAGFTANNYNLRYGYRVRESGAVVIPGKPDPYTSAKSTAAFAIPTAAPATIPFDTVDTIASQVYPAIYNAATGVFTAPESGLYEVSATVKIAAITASDTVRLCITATSTGEIDIDHLGFVTASGIGAFHIPTTRIFCTKGDTIQIQGRIIGTTRSLSTGSGNQSTMCIRQIS